MFVRALNILTGPNCPEHLQPGPPVTHPTAHPSSKTNLSAALTAGWTLNRCHALSAAHGWTLTPHGAVSGPCDHCWALRTHRVRILWDYVLSGEGTACAGVTLSAHSSSFMEQFCSCCSVRMLNQPLL